jgi:hypothetical protein
VNAERVRAEAVSIRIERENTELVDDVFEGKVSNQAAKRGKVCRKLITVFEKYMIGPVVHKIASNNNGDKPQVSG